MKKMDKETIKEFDTEYKLALTSTIDDDGCPHLTLINTLMAKDETTLTSGEFIKGLSKEYIKKRPEVGFIVMSFDKNWWTGTARWKSKENSGPEYEKYNQIPMFRYNTYLGIHTIHYYDLVDISEKRKLAMAGIISNAVLNMAVKPFYREKSGPRALNKWSFDLMRGLATLKFISFVAEDGYPRVYPIVQAQANGRGRVVIPMHPYKRELSQLKDGMDVAVMCAGMDMNSVMVKGKFLGKGSFGLVDIEKVYNTLPPKHGYVYPAEKQESAI